MKRLLKPLLIGLACGALTFALSGWASFWLLLRYQGFDQVPTDPDYHAAIAMGTWACFVHAMVCGSAVGLATIGLVTQHFYRRNRTRLSESFLPSR
jgi:hypothetical protein